MTARAKRKHHLEWAVLLAGVTLAFGCTKEGTSLVSVIVDGSDARLTGLNGVTVDVTQGSKMVATATFSQLSFQTPASLGVHVPAGVSGSVTVFANGLDAGGNQIAMTDQPATVMVMAGKTTAPVTLHLIPFVSGSGTGGGGGTAPGSGGMGGGAAGGMGNPGSGGMVVATGGVMGTGGVAETGGTGSGGTATGGTAGSGTGNIAGRGAGGSGAAGKSGRSWQGAALASSNNLMSDYTPSVAVDGKGNIVAIYQHGSGLAANYYDYSKGAWGTESTIDGSAMTDIEETSSVAVDKNGNWLVVWQQDPSVSQHGIWQSTSTDGVHWTAPAAITTSGQVYNPVLAMNQDGMAVVVWTDEVPPDDDHTLTGSVRVNGTWSAPHVLRVSTDTDDRIPAAVVTPGGTAIVVWEQDDDADQTIISVWQASFSGGAWSTAGTVESYTAGSAYAANVATNSAGQVILTWLQNTTSTSQLWAQRIPATGAPEAPAMVAEGANIAWDPTPSVTLDENGVATMAWAYEIKTKYEVYTARAPWGQPWAAAMAMETDDDATNDQANDDDFAWVTSPMLGHDTAGNVALVWKKRTGTRFDLWARNYDAASSAWTAATLLETMDDHIVYAPAMAMGPSGVAVASWFYAYEFDIWANVYR